jgi:RimJ/RimL family protein N-acetyltransferase
MLPGSLVRLRCLERADLPQVVAWFNDPDTRAQLARTSPMSLAEEERWFDALLKSNTDAVFVIETLPTARRPAPRMLGLCGIHQIDWKHRCGTVGIVIGGESDRGHGYGTDAMRVLVRHGTHDLNLHRVQLEVFDDNAAARASYARVGFVVEGVRKDAMFKAGRYRDLVMMAVIAPTPTPSTTPTAPPAKPQPAQTSSRRRAT